MIFKQLRYEPLGQASYILGCMRSKKGLVVDPAEDLGVDYYVLEAADLGLTIAGVLETHVHADFISCARELAAETSSPHYLHESLKGIARFDFTPVSDGEVLELGRVRVEVLHTPGHTPEHCCYLVIDAARSDEPWAVLTGDSLFVGDVGRPDLLLEDQSLNVLDESQRAEALFGSITEKLFSLPDHVEVWPGHYGGSTCGGVNMSGKASSTIYFEKHFNLAIKQPDVAAFAAFVKSTARPFPDDYVRVKSTNLGLVDKQERAGESTSGIALPEVGAMISDGAVVIDLRSPLIFARHHVAGAVNLQFNRADLADRAEMVLPEDQRLILYAESDQIAGSASEILTEAGYTVLGIIEGGLARWQGAGYDVASLPVIGVDELQGSGDKFSVIDAREGFEYRYGHIEGARLLSSMSAWDEVERVPDGERYAVVCGDQVRSSLVASLLLRAGREAYLVAGGMTDWMDQGLPVVKEQRKKETSST
ncbi:MAG: MBL fold metallo-hydrolase [Actinomycetota bacterium]